MSLDTFFNGVLSDPVKLAVAGCGCSVATEPVAEISYQWNISQVIPLHYIKAHFFHLATRGCCDIFNLLVVYSMTCLRLVIIKYAVYNNIIYETKI